MKTVSALISLVCLVALTGGAFAHAMLKSASPAVGGTVKTAPPQLTLSFSEALEPAFSTIEVRNGAGQRVDGGKAQVNRAKPTELSVPLKALAPGSYKVNWRVLSVDTHRTEGNFSFRVGE